MPEVSGQKSEVRKGPSPTLRGASMASRRALVQKDPKDMTKGMGTHQRGPKYIYRALWMRLGNSGLPLTGVRVAVPAS